MSKGEVPNPTAADSTNARATGEYFKIAQGYVDAGVCVFCSLDATGQFPLATSRDGRAKLLLNKFPRSKFDMLAITTRHIETPDSLTVEELVALHEIKLLGRRLMREALDRKDIFFMTRDGGDKTVPHYHEQVQSFWPGLITWSYEEGRAADLNKWAKTLKAEIEKMKNGN